MYLLRCLDCRGVMQQTVPISLLVLCGADCAGVFPSHCWVMGAVGFSVLGFFPGALWVGGALFLPHMIHGVTLGDGMMMGIVHGRIVSILL